MIYQNVLDLTDKDLTVKSLVVWYSEALENIDLELTPIDYVSYLNESNELKYMYRDPACGGCLVDAPDPDDDPLA